MRTRDYTAILIVSLIVLVLSAVVFAGEPQGAIDTGDLFQRVKARMATHLAQLPNYTCHETINRTLRVNSNFRYLDTIELEVAFVGKHELFARTGETKFGEQPIEKLVSGGTIGNSALGSHIDVILAEDAAEFKYAGECKKDGRKTHRFDLRVPIEKSGFRVRHEGRTGMAGYEGSVWVDSETLDLVRVEFKVNQIPSYLGVRLIEESMRYKKLKIGNSEFELPDQSQLGAMDDKGNYTLNMIKLTGCREFGAESMVTYGSPIESTGTGTAARDRQDR